MEILSVGLVVVSLALYAQSLVSIYLMLFSWDHPERLAASRGPRSFLPPRLSFSVLLPARHEEAVIFETIRRVVTARYPRHLLEVIVICHAEDHGTIAEANRAIRELGATRARVVTFADGPISKPHGLNVGFRETTGQVITIFDAEDDIDPDIFNVVNTIMLEEEVGIVQGGVQLMNYLDHWFSIHNVLEYFFWFKSRLHFHAQVGMVPLGGNTVFVRADLIERVGGWDDSCLTEDADIGLRLSALGEPIRVVYDPRHVTREETPETTDALIRQRTRWNQGFLQAQASPARCGGLARESRNGRTGRDERSSAASGAGLPSQVSARRRGSSWRSTKRVDGPARPSGRRSRPESRAAGLIFRPAVRESDLTRRRVRRLGRAGRWRRRGGRRGARGLRCCRGRRRRRIRRLDGGPGLRCRLRGRSLGRLRGRGLGRLRRGCLGRRLWSRSLRCRLGRSGLGCRRLSRGRGCRGGRCRG